MILKKEKYYPSIKEHLCPLCGENIEKKELYHFQSWSEGGIRRDFRFHNKCLIVAVALNMTDGHTYDETTPYNFNKLVEEYVEKHHKDDSEWAFLTKQETIDKVYEDLCAKGIIKLFHTLHRDFMTEDGSKL